MMEDRGIARQIIHRPYDAGPLMNLPAFLARGIIYRLNDAGRLLNRPGCEECAFIHL